jgi:CBS-domain-containing membrane protein
MRKEEENMSLLRQGKAQMLTLYLGESDQWQGQSLYVAILQLLRQAGCAGATVTRAIAGYGAGTRLHEHKVWHWSSDAPVIIQVVDQPARLQRLLPQLQEMMQGGLMTLHDVEVLKYTHARRQGVSGNLPVRQIMETAISTALLETPAATIVERLLQAPFRVLPIVDGQHILCGIISTGDLITAGLLPMRRGLMRTARELDKETAEAIGAELQTAQQSSWTAQEIMNRQVRTIRPDQSIREAAQILIETQIRNLPVVDAKGVLRGMVTRADLLQAIRTSPLMNPEASSATQPLSHTRPLPGLSAQEQPVTTYLNTEVVTVEEGTSFAETIDVLLGSPLKRVIVIDSTRHVKGIISDVDVLAGMQEEIRPRLLTILAAWARNKSMHLPTGALHGAQDQVRVASDVMNTQVATIASTASIQDAVELMMRTHHKILPVLDQNACLIGTIGRTDMLRVLLEEEEGK